MVKRYRNSPSIILWSMGNEEWHCRADNRRGRVYRRRWCARTHELDPTRLCSAAVNGTFGIPFSDALDVEGFNYNLRVSDG